MIKIVEPNESKLRRLSLKIIFTSAAKFLLSLLYSFVVLDSVLLAITYIVLKICLFMPKTTERELYSNR